LRALGHTVAAANGDGMGGYQAVSFTPFAKGSLPAGTPKAHAGVSVDAPIDGVYRGASDHRKDGQAVGW
jgi:gamma-glutamyltranspeptidase/glutathione hydrolase